MKTFCESGGLPLVYIESKQSIQGPLIYLSAGIHGDEAAATEALITWAEENPDIFERTPLLIFPCLNPWGLVNNSRFDAEGRDLNRAYTTTEVPQIAAQSAILRNKRLALALTLHEDYDAHGVYVYELTRRRPFLAEEILKATSRYIPVERRQRIERRLAQQGIIRRRVTRNIMPHWPEALLLHFHHSERTLTIETPSEFHIDSRVAAHMAAIKAALRMAQKI